jgi:ubiquitin-protein ligase
MSQRIPKDFKEIIDEKSCLEGILAELIDPADFSRWRVYIQAPEGTPFSGGVFLTQLTFPPEYPMLPPELTFISEMFHPNVYPDGKVCISILHPPGKDLYSDERPEERWMPSHSPLSIFNCFLTLLSEPNIFSPANIDASVMWRDNKQKFGKKAAELVALSKKNLPQGVLERIPHPDTDPTKRARRIADKIAGLDQNDKYYNKTKQQLQKVIQDVLLKVKDRELATSLYEELCPHEIDFDQDGGGDDLVQDWDDDNDGSNYEFSDEPLEEQEARIEKKISVAKVPEKKPIEKVEPNPPEATAASNTAKSEVKASSDEKSKKSKKIIF